MISTIRSGLIALTAFVILVPTGAASASVPRVPETAGSAPSVSPYAESLATLGGRTLAQYLADHQVRDRRLG